MAIVIEGKTGCAICGRVFNADDDIVAFTAFLRKTHPLWRYSDSAMHRKCYESMPEKEELARLYSRFQQIWDSRPKTLEEAEEWAKTAFKEFE